jgi:cellulose synthase/poly-beta-1,6-N-acetylglucosamine synthase-like glycosyltransferase
MNTPLWQKFLVYESWFNGFISIAAIKNRFPLTCTGRNLAYKKNDFFHIKGFSKISHSLSGDDDLLMHLFNGERKKISAIFESGAAVYSKTVTDLPQLWRQKTRHISASKYYPFEKRLFYFFWYFCWFFITISPILATIFSWFSISVALIVFFVKLIFDFIFHFVSFNRYQHLHLLQYFMLFQLIYPVYIMIIGIVGFIKTPKWDS